MAPANLGSKAASATASLTQISNVTWRYIGCQLAQRSSDIVTLQSSLVPILANKTRAQPTRRLIRLVWLSNADAKIRVTCLTQRWFRPALSELSVSWRRVSLAHGNKKFARDFPRIPALIAKVNFISNKSTYVIPLKGDKWQQWQHLRDFLDCQLRACSHDVRPSLSMQPKACLGTIRTIQTQRRYSCCQRRCPSARCCCHWGFSNLNELKSDLALSNPGCRVMFAVANLAHWSYKLTALVKLFRFWFCRLETPTLSAHEPSEKNKTRKIFAFLSKPCNPTCEKITSPNPISSWTSGAIRLFIQLRPGLWWRHRDVRKESDVRQECIVTIPTFWVSTDILHTAHHKWEFPKPLTFSKAPT